MNDRYTKAAKTQKQKPLLDPLQSLKERSDKYLAGLYWTMEDIQHHTTLSYNTLHSYMEDDPMFPRPFQLSSKRKVWSAIEINDWILSRERSVFEKKYGSENVPASKKDNFLDL